MLISVGSGSDAELVEEPPEQRVGAVVEHDEARVDGGRSAGNLDVMGVGVPAQPVVALEQRHVVGPGRAGTPPSALRPRHRPRPRAVGGVMMRA